MTTYYNAFVRHQNLGMLSTALGILGGLLCWWNPAGMVLSVAGLMLGLIGWMRIGREAGAHSWVFAGMIVSILTLALCLYLGISGHVLVVYTSYQQ
jgi:hypothetical protein